MSNVVSTYYMFNGASSFNKDIGNWNLSNDTTMMYMFKYASSFNQDISNWNVSNVTTMNNMFYKASSFDQNIGNWDISNVTNMGFMFSNVTLSTQNYDSLLIGWSQQTVQAGISFDGGESKYSCDIDYYRNILTNSPNNWSISDGGSIGEETTITSQPVNQEVLSGDNASFSINVDGANLLYQWRLNNINLSDQVNVSGSNTNVLTISNVYNVNVGVYSCIVKGVCDSVISDNAELLITDASPMVLTYNTSLSSGTVITLPLNGYVNVMIDWGDGSNNNIDTSINVNHTYASDGIYTVEISGILTHFGSYNYQNAEKLTEVSSFGDIGTYDYSYAFNNASNLTVVPSLLNNNVTNMSSMFKNALLFNSNISNWDVSNVTSMHSLFRGCFSFNQDISNWNVSNVTNMAWMFFEAEVFNQDIGEWDVSNVTDMSVMFSEARDFNQDISIWNVSNVTNMQAMFDIAEVFNQNIGSWDVSNVTNMYSMFNSAFNFNQDIGGWDVSNVTDMSVMFRNDTAFNQDISSWDVSNVNDMGDMFQETINFDQNLGSWQVGNVTDMTDLFYGITLSTDNYDSILIGWANQTLQSNVEFDGGNSQYSCIGFEARNTLTNSPNNWTITDAGINGTETSNTIDTMACESYTSPSGNYTWLTNGTYNDTIPNATGCDSVITINLTIINIDNTVTKDSASFTANATGLEYQWLDCDNNYSIISGATTQTYIASSYGSYSVKLTFGSCIDTSDCIGFYPDTVIFINPNDYNVATQETTVSINNCDIDYNNVDSANIYTYSYVDASTTEITIRIYYSNGTYAEIVKNINTPVSEVYEVEITIYCSNKSEGSIVFKITDYVDRTIITSIDNLSMQNIKLYPNPTTGIIYIKGKNIEQIKVFNSSGSLIKTFSTKEINLSNEPKSLYFIKIITKTGIISKKIILK